jgi:hypothetical protein
MQRLEILMVAPEHPDLPNVASELAAVSNQHHTVRLVGTVRDNDIAQAVQEGPYDVIWFATHGTPAGVVLSDGLLTIEGVGQYVRASGAKLCIFNTCTSENVALSIITGGADMICTIGAIDDHDAARLAILLAGELARQADPYEAYLKVRPEGGKYRYYKAGPAAPRGRWNDQDDRLDDLIKTVYHLDTQQQVIAVRQSWFIGIVLVGFTVLSIGLWSLWQRVDNITYIVRSGDPIEARP